MSYSLNTLISGLMTNARDELYAEVEIITASDAATEFQVTVDFLRKFIKLRQFNGYVVLHSVQDLVYLANLDYMSLTVDINQIIDDPRLLLPLVKRGQRSISFINLASGASIGVEINNRIVYFFDISRSTCAPLELAKVWLPLLRCQHISMLNSRYCLVDFINNLPDNIEVLLIDVRTNLDLTKIRPRHNLAISLSQVITSICPYTAIQDQIWSEPVKLNAKITQFNVPIRYNPMDMITMNPHLESVGIDMDTIDDLNKITTIMDNYTLSLCLWISTTSKKYHLEGRLQKYKFRTAYLIKD